MLKIRLIVNSFIWVICLNKESKFMKKYNKILETSYFIWNMSLQELIPSPLSLSNKGAIRALNINVYYSYNLLPQCNNNLKSYKSQNIFYPWLQTTDYKFSLSSLIQFYFMKFLSPTKVRISIWRLQFQWSDSMKTWNSHLSSD